MKGTAAEQQDGMMKPCQPHWLMAAKKLVQSTSGPAPAESQGLHSATITWRQAHRAGTLWVETKVQLACQNSFAVDASANCSTGRHML